MRARLIKWTKRITLLVAVIAVTLLAARVYDTQRGAPIEPWHTFVPHELNAKAVDGADWAAYLKAEDKIFAEVKKEVSQKLDAGERIPVNRYFEGSPIYPEGFSQDWNRSYVLEPEGHPVGAVVFCTGSPILPIACAISRGAIANMGLSRSPSGCPRMAPFRAP